MNVRWTAPAADDFYNLVRYIKKENQSAADRVANTIYLGWERLGEYPHLGRPGRINGTRELVFSGLPYNVVYRLQKQFVEILRVYHAAQDWP